MIFEEVSYINNDLLAPLFTGEEVMDVIL